MFVVCVCDSITLVIYYNMNQSDFEHCKLNTVALTVKVKFLQVDKKAT